MFCLLSKKSYLLSKKGATLRPVQTHSTLYTIQHSTCILYKVECIWTPCIVPNILDSTSLIVYSHVWKWSNFYTTTTRLFLCFAITEAILYKVELVWTHHSTCRALYCMRACAVEVDEITHKQEFKMAEGEKQNEKQNKIKETQQNKATNGRTKGRKWSDQETNLLIDLLEEHNCLWDVYSKEYSTVRK